MKHSKKTQHKILPGWQAESISSVRKEHFVMDSEYLVTLLVVVPLALQPDWNNRVSFISMLLLCSRVSISMLLLLLLYSWVTHREHLNLNVVVLQPVEHLNVVVQLVEHLKQLAQCAERKLAPETQQKLLMKIFPSICGIDLSNAVFSYFQYEKLTDMIVPRSSQLIYQVIWSLAVSLFVDILVASLLVDILWP